jgi:hypothetical protein
MMRDTAYAVSSSDETTKSTSSARASQTSTYSTFVVRMTVWVSCESPLVKIAEMTLTSSRDVHATTRSISATPPSCSERRLVPLPSMTATS